MNARIVLGAKTYEVEPGVSIGSALEMISVPSESVLAILNGEMAPESQIIQDGDQIKLVFVISGG